jgi:hypothetical protein
VKYASFILGFYIFILSLAPNMKGIEFVKVGNLINHYQLHQERNQNSTIWSFIKEHYFEKCSDYEVEHQEMPFKMNSTGFASFFLYVKSEIKIEISHFSLSELLQKPSSYISNYNFHKVHSIWNPPRV